MKKDIVGRHMRIMQMASLLQNPVMEFPEMAERKTKKRGKPASPLTGRQVPTAVAEVKKGDSAGTVRSKQEAVSAANG